MINKDFAIWAYNANIIVLLVFNPRIANRVNKYLKYYLTEKGRPCIIREHEHPIFLISAPKVGQVLTLVKGGYSRDALIEYCNTELIRTK